MTTFKKGDIVTVKGEVLHNQRDGEMVIYRIGYQTMSAPPEELTLITPKFEVGDRARYSTSTVEIIAIVGEQVWIRDAGDDWDTVVGALSLTRISAPAYVEKYPDTVPTSLPGPAEEVRMIDEAARWSKSDVDG